MYILVDLLRHRHFLIGFEIIYNFDDDVLEEYGNIISDKGQVTSPKDQELANTLRKSDFKGVTPRIYWPTREIKPISEFGNTKFFCLAFPWLYPGGIGDIKESRLFDIEISDWAQNLLYYHDGRFAKDKLWRFFTLNCIYRRRNFSQSQWFVKEFTGNHLPSLEELQKMINDGNLSFIDKLMYFGKIIPRSASYWQSKKAELYSWINHHVEKGRGAPSIFLTLSCAEYLWPDIKRILQDFIKATTRRRMDLNKDFRVLNQVLNDYSLIIQDYFHKKVEFFIEHIGKNVFRMTSLGSFGIFKRKRSNSFALSGYHRRSNSGRRNSIFDVHVQRRHNEASPNIS